MPKSPKFPILATAATKKVAETPVFHQVLEHWRGLASRLKVIVPAGTKVPQLKKVTFVQVPHPVPMLGDVVSQITGEFDQMQNIAAIVDPFTVFKTDIFKIFEIAAARHLSLSWMATAHPIRLLNYDTPTGMDETVLTFFCAPSSIWEFMQNRELPSHVPFITPAWGGWMATWATQHVHTHKYHDVTDLHAIGRLEDAPEEEVSLDGLGALTFNPPAKNYVKRIAK